MAEKLADLETGYFQEIQVFLYFKIFSDFPFVIERALFYLHFQHLEINFICGKCQDTGYIP
jgi:hypothetical protein